MGRGEEEPPPDATMLMGDEVLQEKVIEPVLYLSRRLEVKTFRPIVPYCYIYEQITQPDNISTNVQYFWDLHENFK